MIRPKKKCQITCKSLQKSFARKITMTTLERLFSRVFAHVYIQRTSLSARMIALIAFEGLLFSVSALVFFHMRSSSAWIAFERLFSWVDLDVIFEVTISWTWEATLWAAEELFSGVLEFVSFQICQGACIVALITMKRFFSWMGTDVIFELPAVVQERLQCEQL